MEIAPIKTKRDYRRTLEEIEGLMTARRNTPEGDRLDVLVTLVEAWEAKHYPLNLPDPVAAIRYHMEQNGLAAKNLIPYLGSRNRVYEVLNRKRPAEPKDDLATAQGLGNPSRIPDQSRRWRVGPTCLTRYSNAPCRIALDRVHKTMVRRYEKQNHIYG